MYAPRTETIRHGAASYNPQPINIPPSQGFNDFVDRKLLERDREYKETEDLYDKQEADAKAMERNLEGLEGKDYEEMQKRIVSARDRLKNLYKDKKLKDTRSPEFQRELFNIQSELGKAKNGIDTFYGQIDQVSKYMQTKPSLKKEEITKYINDQMQLPPDQREPDLFAKISTDPLFFNAYDWADSWLSKRQRKDGELQVDNGDIILNYDASHLPEMGSFDAQGNFITNISTDMVKEMLAADPQFKETMKGMLPREAAYGMAKTGNNTALEAATIAQTKEFLKAKLEGAAYDKKQTGKTIKYWEHQKSNATDEAKATERETLGALQQRLLSGDPQALAEFETTGGEGQDGVKFSYNMNAQGQITEIVRQWKVQDPYFKSNWIPKRDNLSVDPNDPGSVQRALEWARRHKQSDKDQIKIKKSTNTTPPKPKQQKAKFDP